MAEQNPFDPGGGPGSLPHLNAESDKLEPPGTQPISEPIQDGMCVEATEANRHRANTHPPGSAEYLDFEYARYVQVPSTQGRHVDPPSQLPYGLQTASYSRQAYNLLPAPPYSAHLQGSFAFQYSQAHRRYSLPLRYHPYLNAVSSHAPLVLQDHSPLRGDFEHHDASLLRTRAGAPQLCDSPTATRKEYDPLQTSHDHPVHIDGAQHVSGSKTLLGRSLQSLKTSEVGPQAQEVLYASASKNPADEVPQPPSVFAGPKIPSGTSIPQRPSKPLTGLAQAKLIVSLANPNAVVGMSVREVFSSEQCDKILWLALHGIPSRAIGHLLTIGSERVQVLSGKMDKKTFVALLSSIVHQFVPELAAPQNEGENLEGLVNRLLDRGDALFWSPFLLKHAIDYTFISNDDGSNADLERIRNARERRAVPKWSVNGEESADIVLSHPGRKRQNSTKKMMAMEGVMREASEQEIIEEHFGYRDGNHEVEEALMKKWLLKIRELGRLPDRSEVAPAQVEDNGLDMMTAT